MSPRNARELTEVARALRGDIANVATGEHGLAAVQVLEATRASLERGGRRVAVGYTGPLR